VSVQRIDYVVNKQQVTEAAAELDKLDKATEGAKESTEDLTETNVGLSDQLKTTANNFQIAGVGAGDLASGLGKASAGAKTLTTSSKALSIAMKAIPVLALVGALTSLFAFFTKTERGAQKLRVAMAFLEGAFGAVMDVVISFGESLVAAFENPQKALQNLADNVRFYFTEFIPNAFNKTLDGLGMLGEAIALLFKGEFSEALDTAKEGAIQLADGITDLNPGTAIIKALTSEVIELGKEIKADAIAAADLENQMNKLIVAERQIALDRAIANKEIERQKFIAEDVKRSFEEREAAARKAFDLENELLERELALQRERVRIIEEQNTLSESGEEDIQAEYDARIALANLEQTSATKQIELNNKLNTILQQKMMLAQQEEAQKKAAWEAENAREAEMLKAQEQKAKDEAERLKKEKEFREQEFLKLGDAINQRNTVEKAIAIKKLAMNIPEMASNAFNAMVGIPVVGPVLAPIAAGAAVAFGAKQLAQLTGIQIPKFKEGVIGLQGGTPGVDSIPALLMPGESVMTTAETAKYGPTLEAIREGVDPTLINNAAKGAGAISIVEVPRDRISFDQRGFTAYQNKLNTEIAIKQAKYST
jgi:hypothetical protein